MLLNLVIPAAVIIAAWVAWKKRSVWPFVILAAFIFVYNAARPNYVYKGTVEPALPVPFEQSNMAIEDRQLKPKDGATYDAELDSQIKDGLPFK